MNDLPALIRPGSGRARSREAGRRGRPTAQRGRRTEPPRSLAHRARSRRATMGCSGLRSGPRTRGADPARTRASLKDAPAARVNACMSDGLCRSVRSFCRGGAVDDISVALMFTERFDVGSVREARSTASDHTPRSCPTDTGGPVVGRLQEKGVLRCRFSLCPHPYPTTGHGRGTRRTMRPRPSDGWGTAQGIGGGSWSRTCLFGCQLTHHIRRCGRIAT